MLNLMKSVAIIATVLRSVVREKANSESDQRGFSYLDPYAEL